MKSPPLRRLILTLACFAAGWLAVSAMGPETTAATKTVRILPQPGAKTRPAAELDDLINAVHRAGGPGAQMKAALALAASIPPADYERMLERSRFLPAAAQKLFTRAVLRRWIELDPATAVKWCAGNADKVLSDAVRHWTERDPVAARAFITTLPPQHRRNGVIGCADALAATDPAAAIAFIAHVGTDDSYMMRRTFGQLAERDPKWLIERAESLPASLRGAARAAAVRELGKNDVAAGLAWARGQPDEHILLHGLVSGMKDQSAALSVITALPQHLQKSVLDSSCYELSRKDPKGMLALLGTTQGLSDQGVQRLMDSALQYLAAKDSAAAAAQLQREIPDRLEMWSQFLARQWARHDPSAAKAWAATLPDGQTRERALKAIEQSESSHAAGTAGTPAARLLANARAGQYVDRDAVLMLSPAERAGVLQELGGGLKGGLSNIGEGMKRYFPAEYARWLITQPEQDSGTTATEFAREWAGEEPRNAAAWVLKLPAGDSKNAAAGSVAGQWAALDPAAARQWVQSLPAGPERDRALQALEPPAAPQ